jgi:hypothetical protein
MLIVYVIRVQNFAYNYLRLTVLLVLLPSSSSFFFFVFPVEALNVILNVYVQLTGGGKGGFDYRAVKRWTTEKKLGYFLIDCDKVKRCKSFPFSVYLFLFTVSCPYSHFLLVLRYLSLFTKRYIGVWQSLIKRITSSNISIHSKEGTSEFLKVWYVLFWFLCIPN